MALTTAERDKLPKKNFARPSVGKATPGSYPLPDKRHVGIALGFAKMHGDTAAVASIKRRAAALGFSNNDKSKEAAMSRNVELHRIARELGVMARVPGPDRLREAAYKIAALSPLMGAGIGAGVGGIGGYLASHDSDPDHPNSGLGGALAGAAGGAALGGGGALAAGHAEEIGSHISHLYKQIEALKQHVFGGGETAPHGAAIEQYKRDMAAMDKKMPNGPAAFGDPNDDMPNGPAAFGDPDDAMPNGPEAFGKGKPGASVKQAQRLYEFCRRVGCDEESIKQAFTGR